MSQTFVVSNQPFKKWSVLFYPGSYQNRIIKLQSTQREKGFYDQSSLGDTELGKVKWICQSFSQLLCVQSHLYVRNTNRIRSLVDLKFFNGFPLHLESNLNLEGSLFMDPQAFQLYFVPLSPLLNNQSLVTYIFFIPGQESFSAS